MRTKSGPALQTVPDHVQERPRGHANHVDGHGHGHGDANSVVGGSTEPRTKSVSMCYSVAGRAHAQSQSVPEAPTFERVKSAAGRTAA